MDNRDTDSNTLFPDVPDEMVITLNKFGQLIATDQNDVGSRTALCIPSWCTENWIAAVLYGQVDRSLIENIECKKDIYQYLYSKPASERILRMKNGKIKKSISRYRGLENKISNWESLYGISTQAKLFSDRIGIVIRGIVTN